MIGVLGAGHLGGHLAAGLARAGRRDVAVSPRGQGPAIAAAHGLTLAADNAALVAASEVVLLAVRPADAAAAVAGLPWRAGQVLVSCCAGVPLAALAAAAPAAIMRAMPLSAARIGASPTAVWPDLPAGRAVLALIGEVIALGSEAEFAAASVMGAVYGWVHALIAATEGWAAGAGLEEAAARRLAAATFAAAARMAAEDRRPMDEVVAGLATPGGITEAGLDMLGGAGVPEAWSRACAAARARMRG